ncbi:MAG: 3,4-dihydroxy 2-butanone 4-phosphate synthase / GTP cyclohydrolase II [archaeon GW2011_AR3]|nr:MAG: 3,4-dihydroxy 2-butanone 4-phosphate synthase / GTP cyclohydrolase II [archaeon GW2011_AR3]MBS3109936.1 3,4-dihydroxy-2-butanone-4-phosphate synthase [Candidatus Woesearchaeota archaeon]
MDLKTHSVEQAIIDIRNGKFIVIFDPEREKEGDLVIAAKFATPPKLKFLMQNCYQQVCVPMTEHLLKKMGIPPMTYYSEDFHGCRYALSCDSKKGGTGVSARDKSLVIQDLVAGRLENLSMPGHTFPLIARPGGLFQRRGHTEASIDLLKLAGIKPEIAVLAEIIDNKRAESATGEELEAFIAKNGLTVVKIQDILDFMARPGEPQLNITAELKEKPAQ